jgi:hypothetical protein
VAVCAVVVAPALAAPVAAGAAQPTLKLALPLTEQVGEPIAITAKGSSDGTLRLFLFADEQRRPCAAGPSVEQHGSWELTPYGGEQLPAGEFALTYSYTPQLQIAELCAYLDDTASGVPVVTARTPDSVREYQESATETPSLETRTEELPGAIKPQPVNQQLMKEYWARVEREEHEHQRVRTSVRACVVPRLRGRTLMEARRTLQEAGCVLGHIGRRGASRRLVVVSQGTAAGRVLQGGAAVAVALGSRRH